MNYYLGVDMGSSSIKAVLINDYAEIIDKCSVPVDIINIKEGFFEIDPQRTWIGGFEKAGEYFKAKIDMSLVKGICISSLCGTFTPVDENFNNVYNAILYGIDVRSKEQVEKLNKTYGEAYLTKHLGGIFTSHSVIPKLLWLKENEKEAYNRSKYFVSSYNFVSAHLTGKAAWDYPTAMGCQMVDLISLKAPDLVEEIGIDSSKIPQFSYCTDVLGKVSEVACEKYGFPADCEVFVGGCDINTEIMSLGTVYAGDLTFVLGTTLSTLYVADTFMNVEGFKPGISVLKGTYRLGAASSCGARFTKWVDNLLKCTCSLDMNKLPTEIVMLPYLDGSRSPLNNPDATPVFFGMKSDAEPNDLCMAAREAIGYEIAMVIKMLGKKTEVKNTFYCTGGMANIKELVQIISDITGKTVIVNTNVDASYGAALIAISSKYSFEEVDKLDAVMANRTPNYIAEPNLEKHDRYNELSKKYIDLYNGVKHLF